MKKIIGFGLILALASVFLTSNVFAAGKKNAKKEKDVSKTEKSVASESESKETSKKSSKVLKVATLNGPTSIPVAYFFENKDAVKDVSVELEICSAANVELPKLLKGEVDIGFLPPNAAAKVFTANKGSLVCLGISDNGNLSLITTDETLTDLASLKGKKVNVAGMGSTPEYMFKYLLEKNGIEVGSGEDKVELDFTIAASELPASVISGKVKYAVVPEPFGTVATMKGPAVKKAIDLQKEFEKVEGAGVTYPITLMVARADFAKANPEIVENFKEAFKVAVEWTNKNPQKSGVAVQQNTLGLLAPIVAKSIPAANFVFVPSKEGRASIEKLLGIFLQFAPESVGGGLPADEFYY